MENGGLTTSKREDRNSSSGAKQSKWFAEDLLLPTTANHNQPTLGR